MPGAHGGLQRGEGSPETGATNRCEVLGIEPGSSGKAASARNCRALSPASTKEKKKGMERGREGERKEGKEGERGRGREEEGGEKERGERERIYSSKLVI